MYASLPLKRLLALLCYPPMAIFVVLFLCASGWIGIADLAKLMTKAVAIWGATIALMGGSAKWWSPWRLVWQLAPPLNRRLFPDLNGRWTGTTSSNWPTLEGMLHTVEGRRSDLCRDELARIPLKEDAIEVEIRASLFKFVVLAKLSSTGGTSKSVTETLRWHERTEQFELSYLYQQDTPQPQANDETSHYGAATLTLDMEGGDWRLKGNYWTTRNWRSGLNTAGRIDVERVSGRSPPPDGTPRRRRAAARSPRPARAPVRR